MNNKLDFTDISLFRSIVSGLKNSEEDFGLARVSFAVGLYNFLYLLILWLAFDFYLINHIIVLAFSVITLLSRRLIVRKGKVLIFFFHLVQMILFVWFDYESIGLIDKALGGLSVKDQIFHEFDLWLYGVPAGNFILNLIGGYGSFTKFCYDLLMLAYMSYYIWLFLGVILIFIEKHGDEQKLLGNYVISFMVYYMANFLLYLLVPVTGPQYFIKEAFPEALPLSFIGQFMFDVVANGQPTYIDCFPSGHTGISLLVTYWYMRFKLKARYINAFFTALIIIATLGMRYHYTLDLICAVPLVIFSYKMSWVFFPNKKEREAL